LQTWTIRQLLEWAKKFLDEKGIPQPKLSAELLLASVLNCSRMQLYLDYERILKDDKLAKFKEYILKRLQHIPVQYILKESYFRNLILYVDQNVLIPRPETELLVDKALLVIKKIFAEGFPQKKSFNILEIGTGSGAISLSIASEISELPLKNKISETGETENTEKIKISQNYMIFATDINAGAIEISKKNSRKVLGEIISKKIEFINCDIIPEENKFFQDYSENVNIIISNPPYVSSNDYNNLPREIKDYEPKEALLAGETGLEFYEKIISRIKPYMAKSFCYLIFETDPNLSAQLINLINDKLIYETIEIDRDYNQRDRIITAKII
jgi:release factor glutamine methyltransferase